MKNQKLWNDFVEANQADPYSFTCVSVAKRVMELLDKDPTPLHKGYYPDPRTAHGMICIADDDINAGGITGLMAGYVVKMVELCHIRGDEFRESYKSEQTI